MELYQPFKSRLQKKLKLLRWEFYLRRKWLLERSIKRLWSMRRYSLIRERLRGYVRELRELKF